MLSIEVRGIICFVPYWRCKDTKRKARLQYFAYSNPRENDQKPFTEDSWAKTMEIIVSKRQFAVC
jgi:hypothetical protein